MGLTNIYWGVAGALKAGANPSVLMIGDSWFWYPVDNLAVELAIALDQQTFVVVGRNGSEASEWSEKEHLVIDEALRLYGDGVQALMLSGGGNDVAGMADFLRLLRDDCSQATTVAECYRAGQPDAILAKINGAYREVILRFRARNPDAPVLMHDYDFAWPTGRGVFGPGDWLLAPMTAAKVPKGLRRDLFKDLITRLGAAQAGLAKEKARLGKLVAIASAGTLPEQPASVNRWWANELHPTPEGFKRLVRDAFLPALDKILVA
jgi:hypothetical protein